MKTRLPGFVTKNHFFDVPLDYNDPKGKKITVFGREVRAAENEHRDLPWMVFMQGGPGFSSPRPGRDGHGTLGRGLRDHHLLLLDQRGTGLSSRISFENLISLGSAKAQAKYLMNFRADSIVRDAEIVRTWLLGKKTKWKLAGQSYGGFIATTYLSFASEGLEAALITGGVPPTNCSVDDVYRATFKRVVGKNQLYYQQYPQDVEAVQEIVSAIKKEKLRLPSGDPLTAERFLQVGLMFGASYGFQVVHYLVEEAFDAVRGKKKIGYAFLRNLENFLNFDTNPIYALLHEACYTENSASNWSAERVMKEFKEFSSDEPYMFTGEMIYSWMFKQYSALKPLKEAAQILAEYDRWPALYDLPTLRKNKVPVAAAVYYDDMYVDLGLSEATAKNINGIKLWITNQFEHDASRTSGDEVIDRLLSLVGGRNSFQAGLVTGSHKRV